MTHPGDVGAKKESEGENRQKEQEFHLGRSKVPYGCRVLYGLDLKGWGRDRIKRGRTGTATKYDGNEEQR